MIYFVQESASGAIKIGFTEKPLSRVRKMSTDTPGTLTVLALIEGNLWDERVLHKRFAGCRLRGEWFSPSDELLQHIEGLSGINFAMPSRKRGRRRTPESDTIARLVATGLSAPYAWQLANGKRVPSGEMALKIWRETGLAFGVVKDVLDDLAKQREAA